MPTKAAGSKGKAKEDRELHVAIENHDELRMSILESARQSVGILQREMKLYELKKQKNEAFREMRELFGEIMTLNMKLEKAMPKLKLAKPAPKREAEPLEEAGEYELPERAPAMRTNIDELEMELADIEKRMNSLK